MKRLILAVMAITLMAAPMANAQKVNKAAIVAKLDKADADQMKGKRILIIDDVISSGESLHALEHLVEKAGGEIVGKMTILAEGEAQDREDIIYLEKLPLFHPDGTIME